MSKKISVNFRDLETREFESGTTLLDIASEFKRYFNYPVLVGKVDNHITGLNEPITKNCSIELYDRSSSLGNEVYGRTCQFLIVYAVKKVLGKDADVMIEHSMDKGFYCEVEGAEIDKNIVNELEKKIIEVVKQNLIIQKVSVSRYDAIKYFKSKKQVDKVNVLKYISNSYINLYRIDDIYDYFYGDIAYSTGQIDDFKLTYIKDNGFVLSYPSTQTPECTLEYTHHQILFDKFAEYTNWGKLIEISNAADINHVISTGKYDDLIRLSEAYYSNQLSMIADEIYDKKDLVKMVLIAGPSSAGKTTTSKRLEVLLQAKGFRTHQISIDDYFYDRDKTPVMENGELDTESLNAVDVTLFNKQLTQLLEGKKVELPEYNFLLGKREYKGKKLQLKGNDIMIIEGLHGLNDDLTISIDRRNKFKIYINPLTQLNIDNHNRIHTSDTRKLRRIIRDNKYRSYNAEHTLEMWNNIREGEEKYIYPYQDDVDAMINSSLLYEISVLKIYAEPLLFSVPENSPMYPEALRLINFLRNFLPMPSDQIPNDSVLREFIGGSCFK